MQREELIAFLRRHRLAVQASVAPGGAPQAAVVGIAVSDDLEMVFDTLESTRKVGNLATDPRVALVVGWDQEQTAQIEGVADRPTGAELERLREVYFAVWPDGRARLSWPGITHVRVRPTWVRYSDFACDPPRIVELGSDALGAPGAAGQGEPAAGRPGAPPAGWPGEAAVVSETFFGLGVANMERATRFYVAALGAVVAFASPAWSSLRIAGVRVGLALDPGHAPGPTGLHFAVSDLAAAGAAIERAGGRMAEPATEVAPGVVLAGATDTEGNHFTLRRG